MIDVIKLQYTNDVNLSKNKITITDERITRWFNILINSSSTKLNLSVFAANHTEKYWILIFIASRISIICILHPKINIKLKNHKNEKVLFALPCDSFHTAFC